MNPASSITGFRLRLLIGMMLVVCAVTALALWTARQKVTSEVQQELRQAFAGEVASLHRTREIRHAALVERSRSLARKPRIHAALEDNALDLLYPNAEDELHDVIEGDADDEHPLRARFYRFLDAEGKVITPPPGVDAGGLSAEEEGRLSLARLPDAQQIGYLIRDGGADEIFAAPVISTETNEVIASIVRHERAGAGDESRYLDEWPVVHAWRVCRSARSIGHGDAGGTRWCSCRGHH